MLVAVVVALFSPAALAAPASATNSANDPCGNVVNTGGGSCVSGPATLTPQEQAILNRKQALAQEHAQVRAGTLDAAAYQRDWQAFLRQYGGPAASGATSGGAMGTNAITPNCPSIPVGTRSLVTPDGVSPLSLCGTNYVYVNQTPQQNYYYCGPATAYEILGYQMPHNGLGSTTGPRGESLTQSNLANSNYLQTDLNGGTNWSPSVMAPTLNAWTRSSFYTHVNGSGVGGYFSQSTWQGDLDTDIDSGWALAGNIVEYANTGPRLIGHPTNQTIYHWIAIKGYTSYGGGTTYVDSVSGDGWIWSWANNVPPQSTIDSGSMTTLLNGRGFVW